MPPEDSVVIWRSAMLAASETFIRYQGDGLTRWKPTYVGATKVTSTLARESDVIVFPDTRAGRVTFLRLRLTGASPRLRHVLAATRPRLVHAHFGGDGWLISRSAAELGIPLIVTVHGHDVTRQPGTAGLAGIRYRRNLRTVFDRAALILAVSEPIRAMAIEWGAEPAKVRVHHIGVPIPPVVPVAPKRWDVVFVGRFIEKKGIDDLITALAWLGHARPKALFIGAGPVEQEMRTRAAALRVDATFLGVQPPEAVRRHMAESRILAAPSKTAPNGDTEGLPTTPLEAAALGVPVVSTRHSGIPEAVVHGETGLLGAEADTEALAHNLSALLTDEPFRIRLGRQARMRAASQFDLARQTRDLEQLYDRIAGSVRSQG
jgi:colanic acid/amylovoran biosynthesis glycosyltransferase